MALVTVGNTRIGNSWNVRYENYFTTCEYRATSSFIYYKLVATERSYEKKIRVAFYVRYPSSNQYRNLFGYYPKELIPCVFRAENGKVAEVLSDGHLNYQIHDMLDGWQYYEVYLKRDFEVGEEIWAGVWGETLTPVWDSGSIAKGTVGENFLYLFGLHGRRYDYSPYFDNDEVLDSDQGKLETLGMLGMLGNYSLYWQYFNAPIPSDYTAIIGNPRMGNQWLSDYYIEIEGEDDYEEIEVPSEYNPEEGIIGYKYQLQTPTYGKKMRLHIYVRKPSSKYYLDIYDPFDIQVAPVVYKCNSNWKFTELYNNEVEIITKPFGFSGWIDVDVTLKDNFESGDYIFIGFSIYYATLVWHSSSAGIVGNEFGRWFFCYADFFATVEKIRDGSILNYRSNDFEDELYSIYAEYINVSPSQDYFRSVSSSGNVVAVSFRSAGLKTLLQEIKNIRDSEERKLALFRLFSDVKRVQDIGERKTNTKRNLLTSGNFDDEVLRSSELKRNNSETFGLRDFVFRSVGMFARIFSAVYKSDKTERFVLANRFLKSEYHVAEKTGVRRWIVRAASSLFGLWDFLRGKIREENCQTELFCPVTLELDLTCEVV